MRTMLYKELCCIIFVVCSLCDPHKRNNCNCRNLDFSK